MNRKTKNINVKFLQLNSKKYSKFLITLFIKNLLKNGHESLANFIINKTLFLLEYILRRDSLKVLEQAVYNCRIEFDVKALNSLTLQSKLPFEINLYRSINLAIKNIIKSTVKYSKFPFFEKLVYSIIDAYNQTGLAVEKRKENLQIASSYKKTLNTDDIDDFSLFSFGTY